MSDPDSDLAVAAALLGVDADATTKEIRAAFRARASLLHPDRHHHAGADAQASATSAMQQLTGAYDLLMTRAETRESAEVFADPPEPATYWWRCPACAARFEAASDETAKCTGCGRLLRKRPSSNNEPADTPPDDDEVAAGHRASRVAQDHIESAIGTERDRRRRAWLREQQELADIQRAERNRRRR